MSVSGEGGSAVREGLQLCGVDKLFLQIHDASFPSKAEEDIGRGSPYSDGAMEFLSFVHRIGFNGIQLGPQGATSRDNTSPYDGTVFSRNPLSLPLDELVEWSLLDENWVRERLAQVDASPDRVNYDGAWSVIDDAVDQAYAEFSSNRDKHRVLATRLDRFRKRNQAWLERDVLYTALFKVHGNSSWKDWPDAGQLYPDRLLFSDIRGVSRPRIEQLKQQYAAEVEKAELVQFLVHGRHMELRHDASQEGLQLYADLQIGLSNQDCWSYQGALMQGYHMGAPPSRTNPDGQPWGFAVIDPSKYMTAGGPGPALELVIERLKKIYSEYDGVRVDHPHGWVCPWVYRAGMPDPFEAVRNGARLFSSPNHPHHPELAQFAIAGREQLDQSVDRYGENWVKDLTEEQIDRYAQVFARIVSPDMSSRRQMDLVCEVLSTLPYPLKRVLDRYGLGRFRVLQKVDPHNPADVYRSELAEPVDWIMLGNHDTPPIWKLVKEWESEGKTEDRAADLATRLCPTSETQTEWIARITAQPGGLVHALFADLLISRARSIMVFMSDLLGFEEQYNVPGTVNDVNWSLRVKRDYEETYPGDCARGAALSLPKALVIALQSPQFDSRREEITPILSSLESQATV